MGTDAAFMQAVWIGMVNVAFTIVAMLTIDKWGRKPLLIVGLCGVAISMTVCAYGFKQATYEIESGDIAEIQIVAPQLAEKLLAVEGKVYYSDVEFKQSNEESEMIDWIQECMKNNYSGLLINAGAYTHTSIAIFAL